ncbi:MAG: winged helix-turn-helix domain-containing protein [Nitrososphaerales archaeon]
MNKRRSQLEIQVAILETIAQGNDKPTQIMFSANISWLILQNALLSLETNDLIIKGNQKDRSVYSVTDKGQSVLKDYRTVKETLDS